MIFKKDLCIQVSYLMLLLLSSPCISLANTNNFFFFLEMDQSKLSKNEENIFVQSLIATVVGTTLMCHSSDIQRIKKGMD